ncbi:MAG TPA: SRPBCC family protein [Rubrobacteraceae bacterium]|nr:SRPBCC family protein [Rubrobacteraceae bacterium]
MTVAIPNKIHMTIEEHVIGASVLAPAAPDAFFETVRDVRSFPDWAPGVRRVEVLEDPGGPGMLSEWEVSFLGLRKKVLSVLEEAERPEFLRWTYDGPVRGWGECAIRERGDGTLAEFRTGIVPADRRLRSVMGSSVAREAAHSQLRRALERLGRLAAPDAGRITVGPPMGLL